MNLNRTQDLLGIVARLRDPATGCPWDLKQDFNSLIPYTIEEAYEVADAIDRGDFTDLCGELGDLLLQVVLHSRIAEERGLFDFERVSATIGEKLVNRHPHVFAGKQIDGDEQRKQAWEEAKAAERQQKNGRIQPDSVLDGIAGNLPALMYCEKIQNRAAGYGFDWPNVEPVFEKVREELGEVHEAWLSADDAQIQEEIGDLLLVVVNLARHLQVNPEAALKQATNKFCRRFKFIEREVENSGRNMLDCKLAELDQLWDEAKRTEKAISRNST